MKEKKKKRDIIFFFKQKTAYELKECDWSSDVCSSDLIEITMTVPGAVKVMEELSARYGEEILLGAGTVLDPETTRAAILSGARFIVSPTLNLKVIRMAKRYGVVVCPGALTPTEVLSAWEAGADMVKVFPCDNVGGAKYIRALKVPLPQIKMIPTGGVTLDTAADFIRAGADCLAVGSALIDKKAMKEGNFELIAEKARQFLKIISGTRLEEKSKQETGVVNE